MFCLGVSLLEWLLRGVFGITLALCISPYYGVATFFDDLRDVLPRAIGFGTIQGLVMSLLFAPLLQRKPKAQVFKWFALVYFPALLLLLFVYSVWARPSWFAPFPAFTVTGFVPLVLLAAFRIPDFKPARGRCTRCGADVTPRCQTCDYDLTGNVSGTCPECGDRVPPECIGAPRH